MRRQHARRPGRPSVSSAEPSADVHLKVPYSLYDRVCVAASRAHVSVPEVIRRAVVRDLGTENRHTPETLLP